MMGDTVPQSFILESKSLQIQAQKTLINQKPSQRLKVVSYTRGQFDNNVMLGEVHIEMVDTDAVTGRMQHRTEPGKGAKGITKMEVSTSHSTYAMGYQPSSRLMWQCDERGAKQGQLNYPYGVAFTPDNNSIVVCDNCNERLQVWSSSSGQSTSIIAAGRIKPWDVVVDAADMVYTTDDKNKCIKMYNINGEDRGSLGHFGSPWGITLLQSGHLVVSDCDMKTVSIIDINTGAVIRSFGQQDTCGTGLKGPIYITSDCHDQIIVNDYAASTINLYDVSGRLLHQIKEARPGRRLSYPRGVCVESGSDNIVVVDEGHDRVLRYDASGSFINFVLTQEDGLHGPEGIAYSTNGLCAWTESYGAHASLKLFSFS